MLLEGSPEEFTAGLVLWAHGYLKVGKKWKLLKIAIFGEKSENSMPRELHFCYCLLVFWELSTHMWTILHPNIFAPAATGVVYVYTKYARVGVVSASKNANFSKKPPRRKMTR